jgi:FtsZ-binding cell division protein ZapB
MDARTDAGDMPRLDAFDEEFGREPVAILRANRRRSKLWFWSFFCLLVAAGVGAFALAWPEAVAALRSDLPTFTTQSATRDDTADEVARLQREVEDLKLEIERLVAAEQQAAETIAALRASEQEAKERPAVTWFSDATALSHGIPTSTESSAAAAPPPPRGPVAARPRTGEVRRAAPLSLDPQQ